MKDFFISYTASDKHWAEWVAWQLEDSGYDTLLQVWDFNPGTNFVLEMHNASALANKTIALLSKEYLTKALPAAEWAAAFAKDPESVGNSLIPVRLEDVSPSGLLSSLVYIDLFNSVDEASAKETLLRGVSGRRTKPVKAPKYPLKKRFKPRQRDECKHGRFRSSKFEIEIRIHQDFDSFNDSEKEKFLMAIKELLNIHYDVKITKISPGSVLLRLEMDDVDALNLCALLRDGYLRGRRVSDVKVIRPQQSMAEKNADKPRSLDSHNARMVNSASE